MREAPVLHRLGGGPAAGFDVAENFDRGGDAGGGGHGEAAGLRAGAVVRITGPGADVQDGDGADPGSLRPTLFSACGRPAFVGRFDGVAEETCLVWGVLAHGRIGEARRLSQKLKLQESSRRYGVILARTRKGAGPLRAPLMLRPVNGLRRENNFPGLSFSSARANPLKQMKYHGFVHSLEERRERFSPLAGIIRETQRRSTSDSSSASASRPATPCQKRTGARS